MHGHCRGWRRLDDCRESQLIAEQGALTVWLDASFKLCWKRIAHGHEVRPLARSREQAQALYSLRRRLYELADSRIPSLKNDTAREIAKVADCLADRSGTAKVRTEDWKRNPESHESEGILPGKRRRREPSLISGALIRGALIPMAFRRGQARLITDRMSALARFALPASPFSFALVILRLQFCGPGSLER